MTCEINSGRFTSKDLLVQFRPCALVDAAHVQHLYFQTDVDGGTFKLRVNGRLTAAITFSATVATFVASINTALDAITDAPGDIVASGTNSTDITLTAADPGWYTILVEADALTGNTSADPNVTTQVTTQGTKLYTLTGQVSSFSYEESIETIDVTGIAEYEATEIPVKSSMTFDLSVYRAAEEWRHAVFPGQSGYMYVYEKGKFVGNDYFVFRALFDSASTDFPDHEVVETEMSGVRQGAMVVPFNSRYAG